MQLGKFEPGQQVPIVWQVTVPSGSVITSQPAFRVSYTDAVGREIEIADFKDLDAVGGGKYVDLWTVPYDVKAYEYKVSYLAVVDGTAQTKEDDTISIQAPVVSVAEVRSKWCFGLPLTKDDGAIMSDADIYSYIKSAVSEVERRLGIAVKVQRIKSNVAYRNLVEGIDYDIAEPPYDYSFTQFRQYGYLELRRRPVASVESVKLVLPNHQEVIDLTEWVKLYSKPGQIHIVPYAGSPFLMGNIPGSALPMISGNFGRNIPQVIQVDYTAGMPVVPEDIKAVIAKIASIDILGIAGDAILAGIASLSTSVDGLSESYSTTASATNATYGAHILQYQKEIDAFFDPTKGGARSYHKGFSMRII